MANYSAKIINSAISALAAQQALIAATANNIANVNTPGYSRRTVNLQNQVSAETGIGGQIGSGVELAGVQRLADRFLQTQLELGKGEQSSAKVQSDFLKRAEKLFGLDSSSPTIGSTLTAFFTSANDLASDPSSIELRSNFLQRAQDLVSSISSTYNRLASLQNEADQRLVGEVDTINSLTSQIAALNAQVAQREAGNEGSAADERDRREVLLNQLAEKVSFSTVELADGSVTIQLANGFPLVSGSSARALSVTQSPTFDSSVPPSLSGGALRYITYNYGTSSAPSDLDLTTTLAAGNGSVGGLLAVRGTVASSNTNAFQADGSLVNLASQVEGITRGLLTTVNQIYRGFDPTAPSNGDENNGTAIFDASSGDLNGNTPGVYGLFSFTYSGSRDVNADGLPNDLGAVGLQNYSSILSLAISDPRQVAAARDSNATAGATAFAPGDGRNMAAIANIRSQSMTLSVGNYSFTGTLDEAYNNSITTAGNATSRAISNAKSAEQRLLVVNAQREEVSGVSLDEEFADLVRFQRAYQASGKVLSTANQLLEQVMQLI